MSRCSPPSGGLGPRARRRSTLAPCNICPLTTLQVYVQEQTFDDVRQSDNLNFNALRGSHPAVGGAEVDWHADILSGFVVGLIKVM